MPERRRLLLIAPHFAPQAHAAMFRAHKLAKYLPDRGWDVDVLTVDVNYLYHEDRSLLEDFGPEVRIHRARYIEPTRRGVSMALGGPDETREGLEPDLEAPASRRSAREGWVRRVYRRVQRELLAQLPDAHWTWAGPALRLAAEVIRRRRPDLLLSTAPPYTAHHVAARLAAKFELPWVADFRDPGTYQARVSAQLGIARLLQRRIEGHAARTATACTVAARGIGMVLTDMYGLARRDLRFIPTGVDEALRPAPSDSPRPFPYVIYVGEYLEQYGDGFLRAWAGAHAAAELPHKLLVVGSMAINRPRIVPILERLGVADTVELVDHLPQRALYRFLDHAEAGVLCGTPWFGWWTLHAKMVDYLAFDKTVIASVPNPSEARMHLRANGRGVFLDGPLSEDVARLRELLDGGVRVDAAEASSRAATNQFWAQAQVSAYVDLFDTVLARARGLSAGSDAAGGFCLPQRLPDPSREPAGFDPSFPG